MHNRLSADCSLVAGRLSKAREKRERCLRRGQAFSRMPRWHFAVAKGAGKPRRVGDKCLDFAELLLPPPTENAAPHPARRAQVLGAPKEVFRQQYRVLRRPRWREASARSDPGNRPGNNNSRADGETDLPMVVA